jgi:transcriptional regulator with XRE-family HTH domain
MILEYLSSIMEQQPSDLNERIAGRIRDLRAECGQSLDGLAARCGVSRSMISLIERGQSSPTAVLLEKLAAGLNVPLASLFDQPGAKPDPVARLSQQSSWRDPQSGYVRRNVSPGGAASPIHIVEVSFPPQARVAYETGAREPSIHQQIWVLEGSITVTVGEDRHRLSAGDCLAHMLDRPLMYYNHTRKTARYAVVIAAESNARR